MAPKKKTRGAARTAPNAVQDDDSMIVDTPDDVGSPEKSNYNPLKDLWTDEQETSLFKGIIKWKPAGMHKHFRMIALSGYLRNHGYDPAIDTHTQIPGIWKKLGLLYNLEAIDEREDSFDYGEEDGFEERYNQFSLPTDDFGLEMMSRGRDRDGSASPPVQERSMEDLHKDELPTKKRKRGEGSRLRASTIDDTDDARTSPIPSSAVKAGRGRSLGRRGRSRVAPKAGSTERAASRGTTAEDSEDVNEEDAEEGDEEGPEEADADEEENDEEDEEEEGEEEGEEEEEAGSPSPKASRRRTKEAKGGTKVQNKPRKSTRRR